MVKMKRRISLIIAAAMLTVTLGGCTPAAPSPTPAPIPTPSPAAAQKTSINGFNSELYTANTVMLNVDGKPVYWPEYLYWLASDIYYVYQNAGYYPTDWNMKLTEDMSVKDYVLNSTTNAIVMYRAVEKKANDRGIKLSKDDEAEIEADIQKGITYYETKEAFENYLKNSYLDEKLYRYMLGTSLLYKKLFADVYGENAEKMKDADALAYAEKKGFMKAKHIFMAAGADADKDAEVKAKMQALLEKLRAESSASKRLALFDELMKANSADPGLAQYPDGYVFKDGDMDPSFESTTKALTAGSISDVIKSSYGYHIILRLALSPEDKVMSSGAETNEGLDTIRYYAAYESFQTLVDGWVKDMKAEPADALKNLDLSKIYK